MARIVSRTRVREGRGIGERLSESFVYIVIAIALVIGVRWYFFVYLKSPTVSIQTFFGAMNSGDVSTQYRLLSADSKTKFADKDEYDEKAPFAHGFSARIQNYTITKITESGDKAEADVAVVVRKAVEDVGRGAPGSSLTSTGSDTFNDHFVVKKEADGWKISLPASNLSFAGVARSFR